MNAQPDRFWDDEVVFRTLAAPGLEEDDLFAAMSAPGVEWGAGAPAAFDPVEEPWDAVAERRARHEEILRRWRVVGRDDQTAPSGRG